MPPADRCSICGLYFWWFRRDALAAVTTKNTRMSFRSANTKMAQGSAAAVFPLRRPVVSAKLCPYFILSTWIVAMALHSPYFFARKLDYSEGLLRCALQWEEAFGESSSEASYYVAMFLLLAVIPFALMSILYSIIILNLRAQKIPGGESVRAEELEKRMKRDRSVLQMVLAIVMGFALCWAPFNIFAFLNFFVWHKPPKPSCSIQHFAFFARFMAYANCAINPCICFIFSGNYREGLKSLFGCCSPKCDINSPPKVCQLDCCGIS